MNSFELLRSIYRRLREVPYLGALAEAVRYRRWPVMSTAKTQYEQQQALIEAHGYALSGLRHSLAISQDTLQSLIGKQEEFEKNRHEFNQKLEALHRQLDQNTDTKAREEEAKKEEDLKRSHAFSQQLEEMHRQLENNTHLLNQRFEEQRQIFAQHLEFQRMELLFERRYSASASSSSSAPNSKPEAPRILNIQKLNTQRAQGALRLNVGCGHKPEPERLNVDMRELPGVDIVATVEQLPFVDGELQEIFSSHVLEHFPIEQLRRQLLPAWVRLLRQGGELRAIVPDAQAMLQAHSTGELDFDTLRLITFGGQEYEGDFHHTMFSPNTLAALLSEVGLADIRVEASGRRNGLCLEFEIVGIKP